MTYQKDNQEQKSGNPILSVGLGLAVAMAIGTTLGVLFAPKEGAETQKDIMDKAQKLAKKFNKNREYLQKTVKTIFGEISDELEQNYLELQGNILAQWDEIKDQAKMTKKEYDKIVSEKINEFAKGKKWSEKILKNLQENFTEAWDDLKKSME